MYSVPIRRHLHTAAEAALASLESAPPLECEVPPCLGCLQSMIWPVETEHTNGRARFTVAVLVGLLRVLPERYHSRTYLCELLQVITSDAGLDSLADYARISEENVDTHTCHGNEAELQEDVDELLAVFYTELCQVCEILDIRDAVLKEICERNVEESSRSALSSKSKSNPFEHTRSRLLENFRRSAIGVSREELLKFKCGPPTDEPSSSGKKRAKSSSGLPSKRLKVQHMSRREKQQQAAQERLDREFVKRQREATAAAHALATTRALFPSTAPPKAPEDDKIFEPKPPLGKPLLVTKPRFQGVYPNTIQRELQVACKLLVLAPPAGSREYYFYMKPPQIPLGAWASLPVQDGQCAEGLLLIGRFILQACVGPLVYAHQYQAPLTPELVLSALLSYETLACILIQGGVFDQDDGIPDHFPAQTFLIYLGAVFTTKSRQFWQIDENWLDPIFAPVAKWLSSRGVGDYHENRAALGAGGVRPGLY
ncbi:hypothetical protein C8R46DRAFT_1140946 [Mycena filopes]|nr:hypothetical protein C8R46DRAFT_1140946 [Mycena filopes]